MMCSQLFLGCSITDVTDNVCGQETCLAGPEGYTCGGERAEAQQAWYWSIQVIPFVGGLRYSANGTPTWGKGSPRLSVCGLDATLGFARQPYFGRDSAIDVHALATHKRGATCIAGHASRCSRDNNLHNLSTHASCSWPT